MHIKNHKKVGIEHAPLEDIKEALNQYIDKDIEQGSLTNVDMLDLGLNGNSNASRLREQIANKLNIGRPNAKTFLKRINALNISKDKLLELIGEINEK